MVERTALYANAMATGVALYADTSLSYISASIKQWSLI